MTFRNMRCWLGAWLICGLLASTALAAGKEKANGDASAKETFVQGQFRPRLLLTLPDELNTPDGMRLDKKTNNVIVACPNFCDLKYPAKLIQITPDNRWEVYFDKCLKHPETGYAHPMGMDFGPDGNLYYADNQYFNDKDKRHHWSRVIRVNIKDGKPVGADVVVEGFKLSHAVMFSGDNMFVTDTFFDLPGKPMSGVYRIALAEMQKGLVRLKPKGESDAHLLVTSVTEPFAERGNDVAGADGMTFDSKGNLYFGHFGDGQFFKVAFNADGSVKSKDHLAGRPQLICCDGMCCDPRTDKIYIADSAQNAIVVFDTKNNSLTTLWQNDDTDGADGLLDQPCEPVVRGNDLIIADFDMPFPGVKNSTYDAPHTMSMIRLNVKTPGQP
jgi:sugar lactone lactonase YvrE